MEKIKEIILTRKEEPIKVFVDQKQNNEDEFDIVDEGVEAEAEEEETSKSSQLNIDGELTNKLLKKLNLRTHKRIFEKIKPKYILKLKGYIHLLDDLLLIRNFIKYLSEIKDEIKIVREIIEIEFNNLMDHSLKKILTYSKQFQEVNLYKKHVKKFGNIYKRMRSSYRNFMEIYIEEYRSNTKELKMIAERLILKLHILININPSSLLLKFHDGIKELHKYIDNEDNKIMQAKGTIWAIHERPYKWKYTRFEKKRQWIIIVIIEVLLDMKQLYQVRKEDDNLNLKEEETRKLSEKLFVTVDNPQRTTI